VRCPEEKLAKGFINPLPNLSLLQLVMWKRGSRKDSLGRLQIRGNNSVVEFSLAGTALPAKRTDCHISHAAVQPSVEGRLTLESVNRFSSFLETFLNEIPGVLLEKKSETNCCLPLPSGPENKNACVRRVQLFDLGPIRGPGRHAELSTLFRSQSEILAKDFKETLKLGPCRSICNWCETG
jgi:hypothetical protein